MRSHSLWPQREGGHAKEKSGRSATRETAPVTSHSLRHTFETMLKVAGIPMAVVMELIAEDSEEMSEHYPHVGDEAMKKADAAMPDITA